MEDGADSRSEAAVRRLVSVRATADLMFWRFRLYGFLKNLRFFDPFLILFLREMGLSFFEIGVLYSIREISMNLLEIPTGILADAFGRRRAMLASFAAYLASFAVFYALPSFWAYVGAMVLYAIGETFRSGTHKAMILEHLRQSHREGEKVAYYGRTRAASQLGSAVAALLAGGLVLCSGGYRVVFLASMVPYVLGLGLLLTYPRSLDGERTAGSGNAWHRAAERLRLVLADSARALRQPDLLRGLLSSAGFDAIFKSTKDYLQPILQAQALALPVFLALSGEQRVAVVVGCIYFLIYIGTSFASSRAGRLADRARSLAGAANATFLVGLVALALAGGSTWAGLPTLAVIAYLAVFAIQNLRRPVLVAYLADLLSHRTMATGLSVETQIRSILMACVAPALGFLADRAGVGAAILTIALAGGVVLAVGRVRSVGSGQESA